MPFSVDDALPLERYAGLVDMRVRDPRAALEEARRRVRRTWPAITREGRLLILAADHPARGVIAAGADPARMADRRGYLARAWAVLGVRGVDGVMATPDVIEDLLLLSAIERHEAGTSRLDGRLLVGCMNRGGLSGAAFELDDRFTAYTAAGLARMGLDAGKTMVRVDPHDPGTLETLVACARALDEVSAAGLVTFLEVMAVEAEGGRVRVVPDAVEQARAVGIASALGTSSLLTWLKVPIVRPFEAIAAATTLPMLVLGGDVAGQAALLDDLAHALGAGPNVRGALIGRNVLYPPGDDPVAAAEAVAGLVHAGWTAAQALAHVQEVAR